MTIIKVPTQKVKPNRATTSLPLRYTYHKQPSSIDRFLGIAYRKHGRGLWKSTRIIGVTLFHTLKKGPQVINIAQLARETGYSQTSVTRAIKYFSRFGKVQRINERRTGKRRPCEYKLHSSFTESQEHAKPQEKGRCGVSHLSYRPLRRSKETKTTKARTQLFIESFNRIPRQNPLTQKQKKTAAFLIRFERKKSLVSSLIDSLWQRNCVAAIWQDTLTGLQGLDVLATDTELLWRSRKAVKALVQGATVDQFKAIMEDRPATKQEGVEREVAELDRRLVGLRRWGCSYGVTSWFLEKRSELTRQRYEAERRLPSGICTDAFFKTLNEPQQARRAKRFKLTGFYTAKRQPLSGDALSERKAEARKALNHL